MESGEYGLTRWARFVARCLEVIAVAGLMWVGGVFSVGRDLIVFFPLFCIFKFVHARAHYRWLREMGSTR